MRPIRGSVSPRRKIYPPKLCSSSTKKLTLLLPILRSSRELPTSEPAHFPARLPTSASSSQMKPRSGARWYVPPTSNRSKPPRIFHKSRFAKGGGRVQKTEGGPRPGRGGADNISNVHSAEPSRAASGHAAAAPPSSVTNWRRLIFVLIRSPRRRGRAGYLAR